MNNVKLEAAPKLMEWGFRTAKFPAVIETICLDSGALRNAGSCFLDVSTMWVVFSSPMRKSFDWKFLGGRPKHYLRRVTTKAL